MTKNSLIAFLFFLALVQIRFTNAQAQDIPLGEWRLHVSFSDIHSVSVTPSRVYAAAVSGILIFDRAQNSVSTITRLDGLSSNTITQILFDQPRNQLLVTYADGNIDIIRQNEIINVNTLKVSQLIAGSKRINHIAAHENLAYLSTDFGVVVFDLAQLAIKETWRDIGVEGGTLEINQSTIYNDSIFLATEAGVQVGSLHDNLLDFNNWTRFAGGTFSGEVQAIVSFNNTVYAAVNNAGIYEYQDVLWQLEPYLQGGEFKNVTASQSLIVTTSSSVFRVTSSDEVTEIESSFFNNANIAFEDVQGKLWIGDAQQGLVSDYSGSFQSLTGNGPTFSAGFRLHYDSRKKVMYALSGGFNTALAPLGRVEPINYFSDGIWRTESGLLENDLTGIQVNTGLYLASQGYGLQVVQEAGSILFDESNSPLQNVAPGRNVRVTDIAASDQGIWVANSGAAQSLHLLKPDNTWRSYSFPLVSAARYPVDLEVDPLGQMWMVLNPANGGGILVFNPITEQSTYLTDATNQGGLPHKSVYSIAVDRSGFVWVGTQSGVACFTNPAGVFSSNVNAVKPVFENRFLLRDERVTAIEVDGGNRKWMGTENGIWLFNEFGEEQVYHFNMQNSPLISNKIIDLEVNDHTGELFIMTDGGIASFRSDATRGETSFNQVKIFPNPVTNQFNGHVGISGLVTDAIVKITDVSGRLVWQSRAQGGTATWNVYDYSGRRAATGVYLVFCITQDGSESMVGKIVVVN